MFENQKENLKKGKILKRKEDASMLGHVKENSLK